MPILPDTFQQKLISQTDADAFVTGALTAIGPVLDRSRFPFFTEYTDHGLDHIRQVLTSAEWLIPRDVLQEVVTPGDVAVLTCAILLHDVAMALSERSFIALLGGAPPHNRMAAVLHDRPWQEVWEDFLDDAARWDARRRMDVLGADERPDRPGPDPDTWTARDRRLVGEFIRRNHPRIAFEVALHGYPQADGGRVQVLRHARSHYAEIVALLARSHGMPLRTAMHAFEQGGYSLQEFDRIHIVYLMVLLRIADYLHVEPERAPPQVAAVLGIRSPLSRSEWRVNEAFASVDNSMTDREALRVNTRPEDLGTYLRVKQLLNGIQAELDTSWAVLGEVYGHIAYPESRSMPVFGIRLRRLRSNLEDEEAFARTSPFLPYDASLRAAGPRLMKLLMEPLYGDYPEIGLRELIQNAVDAVLYLDRLDRGPGLRRAAADGADVTAQIAHDKTGWWVEVSDRGVGMTPEVISKYFVVVGSTIRDSTEWMRAAEAAAGTVTMPYTGRFGIGVLAAFILGREMHVLTRHVNAEEERGVAFCLALENEVTQMRWAPRAHGTTVRIQIPQAAAERLLEQPHLWDWFCLPYPRVVRTRPNGTGLRQRWSVPEFHRPVPAEWRRFSTGEFPVIDWTYRRAAAGLTCNGFVVIDEPREAVLELASDFPVHAPRVSVFDPDAGMPLTIRRDGTRVGSLPFESELLTEVSRDFLAWAMVHAPTWTPERPAKLGWLMSVPYWGRVASDRYFSAWMASNTGAWPVDAWCLSQHRLQALWVLGIDAGEADSSLLYALGTEAAVLADVPESGELSGRFLHDRILRHVLESAYSRTLPPLRQLHAFERHSVDGLQLVLPTSLVESYSPEYRKNLEDNFEYADPGAGYQLFSMGRDRRVLRAAAEALWDRHGRQVRFAARLLVRRNGPVPTYEEMTPLARAWSALLDQPWLEAHPDARRRQVERAAPAVGEALQFWRSE
jgi:molecular chaperone HtpG